MALPSPMCFFIRAGMIDSRKTLLFDAGAKGVVILLAVALSRYLDATIRQRTS